MTEDPLSEERIKLACETLTRAFGQFLHGAAPAVGGDGALAMSEAKRNLIALTQTLHGREAWERAQDW